MNEKNYIYQNRTFQIVLLSLYGGIALIGSILMGIFDQQISASFIEMCDTSPFLTNFAHFFDRSLFDGDGFGGQDPGYLLIILALFIYILSYSPKIGEKLVPSRKYSGFMLAAILVMTAVNRGFKALFARARPGVVEDDPSLYSHMWTFGNLSFIDGIKKGSFTSGHTSVAIFVVVLAFVVIGTRKKTVIIPSFIITIGYGILMALGRVFEGDHFLSDGFWSIWIGLLVMTWIYFKVLKIPEQEAGTIQNYEKFEEFRWGILFFLFFVAIVAAIMSLRYMFINFLWYQPIILVCSPVFAYGTFKRAKKILMG